MQELRGFVPAEAESYKAEQEQDLDNSETPEQAQEAPLASSEDLVNNFIMLRPTLADAMKKHGENMNPTRTVEQLVAEAVKSVDVNRGIQLKEIERLSGSADSVKKANNGLKKGIIRALKDKVEGPWDYNEPDVEPGEDYFFARMDTEADDADDQAEVAA